jgi:hypothetical protein
MNTHINTILAELDREAGGHISLRKLMKKFNISINTAQSLRSGANIAIKTKKKVALALGRDVETITF